jgi:crossover junction endodeoxyribonuclease RusA
VKLHERIKFFVAGLPYPKGSYAPILVGGRLVTKTDKNLETWNSLTRAAARRAFGGVDGEQVIDGPISVEMEFVLPKKRGAGHASTHVLADVAPDADKLARAVGDAMIGIIYTDDARIVRLVVEKRWAHGAETTGVLVTVSEIVSQLAMEV